MNRLVDNLATEAKRHLIFHYVFVPILTPLFFAGFILVICATSLFRRESVYPGGPPWGMHEPFATAALGLLCIAVPLPYLSFALWMNPESNFCGCSRRLWRILIVTSFGGSVLLGIVFTVLMLCFIPK